MGRNNVVVAVLVGAVFLLIGLAIGSRMQQQNSVLPPSGVPSTSAPMTGTPQNATGTIAPTQSEANIIVTSPAANQTVGKSFAVTGRARVFENVFQIRVRHDATGSILYSQAAYANAPDAGQYGNFSVQVTLPQKTPQNIEVKKGDRITVEVFQFSAKDGSEIDKVVLPLTI